MALTFNSWTSLTYLFLFPAIVSPLSFNFSSFKPADQNVKINVQGDAYISPEGIQVTTDESSRLSSQGTGRATFINPFHLWDNSSGNATDFNTHFSFIIQSTNPDCSADGLAFFLAPVNSASPARSSGGGLGLAFNIATEKVSGDPFFAVEFDTFSNDWDPQGPHVGIDVNSLISAANVSWTNNMTEGRLNYAWISYKSSTRNLRVVFKTFSTGNRTQTSRLENEVDLRYLPEWVSVGFSAATGSCFEKNNVKSWSFNSKDLKLENRIGNATIPTITPDISPTVTPYLEKKKNAGEVIIGLAVGLSVLLVAFIAVGSFLWRKKNRKEKEEDFPIDISMENEFERGSKRVIY